MSFKLTSSDFCHMFKWVTYEINPRFLKIEGEIIYSELTVEQIEFFKSKQIKVTKVLPSISKLREQFTNEVDVFCANFNLDYQGYKSIHWDNSDKSITIVARFEKYPKLIIQKEYKEYTLPNYGEDLEEIVTANWGYIRNKVPQPLPTKSQIDKFIADLLELPLDLEEETADNWVKEQILALA